MPEDPVPIRRYDAPPAARDPEALIASVARGDEAAFAALYDLLASSVFGLARRVVRNPSLAEEVSQEVFVEVWRQATRFDAGRGTVRTWVLTMTHRRAVDRVRSEQSSADRERRATVAAASPDYDEVVEEVAATLEHEQVRRCLTTLTDLQREAVTLAYYRGYNYREVAELLGANLATVKTRMRDGLIRLRDCLGVDLGVSR